MADPQVIARLVRTKTAGAIAPAVKPLTNTAGDTVKISYTDTAANNTTNKLSGTCLGLRIYATTACFVVFSSAATVTAATTANGMYVPAATPEQLPYAGIQTVSVIRSTENGDLYVTEITE